VVSLPTERHPTALSRAVTDVANLKLDILRHRYRISPRGPEQRHGETLGVSELSSALDVLCSRKKRGFHFTRRDALFTRAV
jgi:hypothetical protein